MVAARSETIDTATDPVTDDSVARTDASSAVAASRSCEPGVVPFVATLSAVAVLAGANEPVINICSAVFTHSDVTGVLHTPLIPQLRIAIPALLSSHGVYAVSPQTVDGLRGSERNEEKIWTNNI